MQRKWWDLSSETSYLLEPGSQDAPTLPAPEFPAATVKR
jgi:hypothetical protein